MGGNCCQLKRDKETELKTGSLEEKSAAGESPHEAEFEARFEQALLHFPFAADRIKVAASMPHSHRTNAPHSPPSPSTVAKVSPR